MKGGHAIGLGMLRRRQAVLNPKFGAEFIELVLAGGKTLAKAEQAYSSGEDRLMQRSEVG